LVEEKHLWSDLERYHSGSGKSNKMMSSLKRLHVF